MVKIISKHVLAKGQIVLPKMIRELLGIKVGDELIIDVKNEQIILSKKQNVSQIFSEVSTQSTGTLSMNKIKKELSKRYEEDA